MEEGGGGSAIFIIKLSNLISLLIQSIKVIKLTEKKRQTKYLLRTGDQYPC